MIDPLFDEMSDGICVTDAQGGLIYMNRAAERLLDLSVSSAKGKTLCELLCGCLSVGPRSECASGCALREPGSAARAVTFMGRYGPKKSFEWVNWRVQRRDVWRDLRVRCLRTEDSAGRRVTILEDGSSEAEMRRQKEDWRQMVAHDIRSPLTNVYATLRLIQDSAKSTAALPEKKLIDSAVRSCGKMMELLGLYLDVAKLDSGLMRVDFEPLVLRELLLDGVNEQLPFIGERGVEVAIEAPEDLIVRADRELLSRVIQNLLNNALKYTPKGGKVTLCATATGNKEVALIVSDTGAGIAAEELPLLFDRYHQAKARREGKLDGTGLGLTFCREALKAMGGAIEADSKPNAGAQFTLRLPAGEPLAKEPLAGAVSGIKS